MATSCYYPGGAINPQPTVGHNANGLIGGCEAFEVYHPQVPADPSAQAVTASPSSVFGRSTRVMCVAKSSSVAPSRSGACYQSRAEKEQPHFGLSRARQLRAVLRVHRKGWGATWNSAP
jgi:hypothetical protein